MKELDKNIKRKYHFRDYDTDWVNKFNSIKDFLRDVFGEMAISIEHIGSTSVPGMKAKPIIDVLVIVKTIKGLDKQRERMIKSGYDWGENYIAPDTLIFFKLGEDGEKLENIHVCEEGAIKIKQFLTMRDYLRSHPKKVEEYSKVKQESRDKNPDDYPAYRSAKAPFLEKLEQEAYEWQDSNL